MYPSKLNARIRVNKGVRQRNGANSLLVKEVEQQPELLSQQLRTVNEKFYSHQLSNFCVKAAYLIELTEKDQRTDSN
jgi:hypothetical protein